MAAGMLCKRSRCPDDAAVWRAAESFALKQPFAAHPHTCSSAQSCALLCSDQRHSRSSPGRAELRQFAAIRCTRPDCGCCDQSSSVATSRTASHGGKCRTGCIRVRRASLSAAWFAARCFTPRPCGLCSHRPRGAGAGGPTQAAVALCRRPVPDPRRHPVRLRTRPAAQRP